MRMVKCTWFWFRGNAIVLDSRELPWDETEKVSRGQTWLSPSSRRTLYDWAIEPFILYIFYQKWTLGLLLHKKKRKSKTLQIGCQQHSKQSRKTQRWLN